VTKPVPVYTVLAAAGRAGGRKCQRNAPYSTSILSPGPEHIRRQASDKEAPLLQPGETMAFLVECADTLPGEYLIPRGADAHALARERLPTRAQPESQTVHRQVPLRGEHSSKHKAFDAVWAQAMYSIVRSCPEGRLEVLQVQTGVPEEYSEGASLSLPSSLHLGVQFQCKVETGAAAAPDPALSPHAAPPPTP
jgi:hypothetical protein